MSFFMTVKLRGTLDEVYNFQTFGQSMILLFQMSTSAGWDGVLNGIMDEDDCEPGEPLRFYKCKETSQDPENWQIVILKPATIDRLVVGFLNQATISHFKLPHHVTVGEEVPEKI